METGPSVGTVLGAAGSCPTATDARGKVWTIGHPTQRAKAVLESLVVGCAGAEVRSLKDVLPPDAYAEAFRAFLDSVTARHYRTWGDGWQRIVWGPQSAHLFLLSLIREHHPEATEDDARRVAGDDPEGVAAALAEVIPNFVTLLLDDRPEITTRQRDEIQGVIRGLLETARTRREPTPETPPESSPTGAKHSPRNRGVSTRGKSPT